MAKAPIDVAVNIKGLQDLEKLQQRMDKLEKEVARLNKTLPKAANGIRKTGRAAATATGNVQRLGIAFRTTFAPITAIVGSITLLTKALNTVGGRDAELATLKNGLNGIVDDADAAANALLEIADAQGKLTLFNEEDFTGVFKLFTSFRRIGVDSYERVAMAAADLAQVTGQDAKSAAMQLAKALEDPSKRVTDLARSGTVFTEQQKAQIKALQESGDLLGAQDLVLKEIEKQYGGAAEAAGSAGFAGALDSAGESWRDFLEVLGQSQESGAVAFLNGIAEGLDFLTRNFDVISQAAQGVVDVLVKPFQVLLQGIQSTLGPIGNFEQTFRSTLAVVGKILTDLSTNILQPLFTFIGKIIGQIITWLGTLLQAIASAAQQAVQFVVDAVRKIADVIAGLINNTPVGILTKVFGLDLGEAAAGGLRAFADGIQNAADSVGGYIEDLKQVATEANAATDANKELGKTDPFKNSNKPTPEKTQNDKGKAGGADKAAKEAEKLAAAIAKAELKAADLVARFTEGSRPLQEQVEDAQKLVDMINSGVKSDDAKQEIERERELADIRLKGAEAIADLRKIENLGAKELQEAEAAINEQVFERIANQKRLNQLKDQTKTLTDQERLAEQAAKDAQAQSDELAEGLAGDLAGGLKNILVTAIKGGDVKQAAMQLVESLANRFLDAAFSQVEEALGGLFKGFLGGEEKNTLQKQQIVAQETQAIAQFGVHVQTFQTAVGQMGAAGGGGLGGLGSLFGGAGAGGGGGIGGILSSIGGLGGAAPVSGIPMAPLTMGFAGPAFATGGVMPPNSTALVGEHGPELISTGGAHARVTNNSQTDEMLSRYGGGGGSMSMAPVQTSFELQTTVINGVEYATVDQVRAMGQSATKQGAKLGEANAMKSLRNRRSTRQSLGI